MTRPLSVADLEDLRRAHGLLESDSFAIRLATLLGEPIEAGLRLLPEAALGSVQQTTRTALRRALRVALRTLPADAAAAEKERPRSRERAHRLVGAASGVLGGLFGLPGLTLDLPVTTVIILRSIAEIARSEGHDLSRPGVRMACLEVFALGGPRSRDDAAETGYFAVRAALAKTLSDAAQHIAERGLAQEGAPVLVRLVERIAARFGLVVEEKVALGAIPLISAASGGLINSVFIEHFQAKARGHFIVRRLEASRGEQAVREVYEQLD